jgi:hypothetical protein
VGLDVRCSFDGRRGFAVARRYRTVLSDLVRGSCLGDLFVVGKVRGKEEPWLGYHIAHCRGMYRHLKLISGVADVRCVLTSNGQWVATG